MGIVDTFKELATLAQKVQNRELYERLVAFQSDIFTLQEENRDLKETVRELRAKLELQGKVVWKKPSYWLIEGKKKNGPFCQKCYDSERKLIRLQDEGSDSWRCLNCKSYFEGPNYFSPEVDNGSDDLLSVD